METHSVHRPGRITVPAAVLRVFRAAALLVAGAGYLSASAADGDIELIRDKWGTPHVFATTDRDALYGLGYAAAEDRGFQMHYFLRIIQGRLAELRGPEPLGERERQPVESDRRMRTIGFARAARQVADNLDAETRGLLQSYCDGVNQYFADHVNDRHYLFDRFGLEPEPWTPADCLLSWWHLAQFFAHDGLGDRHRPEDIEVEASQLHLAESLADDAAAVVKREDVSDEWVERAIQFAHGHGLAGPGGAAADDGPKFSHAWVVGGGKTTTGSAVLVSDPQTPVTNPSLFYEFHVQGATFNVRGVGVAGSPMILIGFTQNVAWGVTALAADQADLFRLKTVPEKPNQYELDGRWHEMDVNTEMIKVRGGESIPLTIRSSWFGPVVTDLLKQEAEGGEFALRRVPVSVSDSETIQSALAIWRSKDVFELHCALAGWQFPTANCVFGDSHGNIGYTTVGAMPIPPAHAIDFGHFAHTADQSGHDWQGMIPYDLVPHVLNPKLGYLWSGNHRVIGRYYPFSLRGSTGESDRSRRLREMLEAKERFEPREVLDMHFDSVNPARRDFVRLGLHALRVQPDELSEDAKQTLDCLEDWYHAGASSALTTDGAALAACMNTEFRSRFTPLADEFGGGAAGSSLFMRNVTVRIDRDGATLLSQPEVAYVNRVLSEAWQDAVEKYGPDSATWLFQAKQTVVKKRLQYYGSLDRFGSVDPSYDLPMPATRSNDISTIFSQPTQAYTQFVPLDDADKAQAILPIGSSERPGSEFRTATLKDWETGVLHPAPLSREAVDDIRKHRTVLTRR